MTVLLVLCALAYAGSGPIVVGGVLPLTGDAAAFGTSVWYGASLAIEEHPRIGASPVLLRVHDDGSNASGVPPALEAALAESPAALLGEVSSSRTMLLVGPAEAAEVPLVSPTATNPAVTQGTRGVFRACFIDPVQGEAMAKFARRLGLRRVLPVEDVDTQYTAGLVRAFREAFVPLGGELLPTATYHWGDVRFDEVLDQLQATNPDAVYVPGYYTEVALLMRAARERGYRGRFLGGDGWDSDHLIEVAGTAARGALFTNHFLADDPHPRSRRFTQTFAAHFGRPADALAALGDDAMGMLLAAADALPAATQADLASDAAPAAQVSARRELREALARTQDYPGATGPITMGSDGNPRKTVVIVTPTQAGGRYRGVVAAP